MQHPYEVLKSEYARLLTRAVPTRSDEAEKQARSLLVYKSRYVAAGIMSGVPAAWIMAINMRESSGRLNTYIGNGQRLDRVTTIVPKGRGPFPTWEAGVRDAFKIDPLSDVTDWSMTRACYQAEAWNGFGPRNHGRYSGYLWAGTSVYQGGKYVADGVWSASTWDQQLGVVCLMRAIFSLAPELTIGDQVTPTPGPLPPVPLPSPDGLGSSTTAGVQRLQEALNALHVVEPPLVVDGSYGRMTRQAVMAFQRLRGLEVDGLAGPKTITALVSAQT